ncbi:MAG: type IV secretion system DNA-binding domain-containing protein, partial [Candidatus Spechtbacterales bacterium]
MDDNTINYFGQIHFRGKKDPFGIKPEDRSRHMYVIGKTGMGKTALLQNMAIQDVINGRGIGIVDPHGDFAERVLDFVPEDRMKDVIYFNPADSDFPVGLNLLEDVGYDKRHLVASGLMGVFKKIWVDVWSARMEYILNNAILALMEYPGATLLDVNRMMTNKEFRAEVMSHVQDPIVREFWLEQFSNWGERLAGEATAAIENKVGQFTAAPLIRNIIGQRDSTINLRKLMDEGKILIINLSKGYIGEENSRLLGAMAITKLYLAAMSRVDIPENERRDFVLYVDEFQNFASEAFEGILSEARKYRFSLLLAHQYIEQMEEEIRAAL